MKFDWCKANLQVTCGEHKYEHCEMCNIARAYMHGYETAKEDMSKTAEWVDSKNAKGYVVCSNCNKLIANINRKKYNYCPFCGADTRGKDNG